MADPLLRAIEANKSRVMAVCGHKVAIFKNVEKSRLSDFNKAVEMNRYISELVAS